VLCAVCCVTLGCAAALTEPPALEDLTPRPPDAEEARLDELLDRADALYAQRTLESARQAVELYL
jgi:hypothetical protein